MTEITRLVGHIGCFELGFMKREATPEPAMKLGIQLHLAGLSPPNTISILDVLGGKQTYSLPTVPIQITLRLTKL